MTSLLFLLPLLSLSNSPDDRPVLTTIAAVRVLTRDDADQGHPVSVTGVVTRSRMKRNHVFLQDDTSGVYVDLAQVPGDLSQGMRVRIEGETFGGEFSPVIRARSFEVLESGPLPLPFHFNFSLDEVRWLDCQLVHGYAIVRDVVTIDGYLNLVIEGIHGGGRAYFGQGATEEKLRRMVGGVIEIRGIAAPENDGQGRIGPTVQVDVESIDDVKLIRDASDLAQVAVRSTADLRRFLPGVSPIPIVRLRGIVTGTSDSGELLIQDDFGGFTAGLRARQTTPVESGQRVEVMGFLSLERERILIRSGELNLLDKASLPMPREINSESELALADGCRVRCQGRLAESRNGQWTVVGDAATFVVRVPGVWNFHVEPDSLVSITGALTRPFDNATATRIFPSSRDDIVVTARSKRPWLSGAQALLALAVASGLLLTSFAWGITLRRAVGIRTRQLSESEQKFATTFRSSPNAVALARIRDGVLLDVNESFSRLTGLKPEQIIGRSDLGSAWLSADDRDRLVELIQKSGTIRDFTASFRDVNGEVHQVSIAATRIRVGEEEALFFIARDVTKQWQAELAVANEKLFADTMIESMPGVLYFFDDDGKFLRWNKNFERESGYSAEEIAAMHPLDFFSESEKSLLGERIMETLKTGESSVEASFVSKGGASKPFYFTGRQVVFDGKPCIVGIGLDISRRKQAERKLSESNQAYRELVELANSIILRWTPDGIVTFMNEFGQHFFGYQSDQIVGKHVVGTIVPPKESTTQRDLGTLMERLCADPGGFQQNVNENMRRSGERVWISWSNRIVRDHRGDILEIVSVGTNITDQRRMEQSLAASERKFATLFQMSPIALSLTTLDGVFVNVNEAFVSLYDYPREKVIGRTALDLPGMYLSPDQRAGLLKRLLEVGRLSNVERHTTRADGTSVISYGSAELVDIGGERLILTAAVDITRQKQAEESLREVNALLERRVAERTGELAEANRELEAFCYSVSHDLRSPLRSIDGFSQAIEEDYADKLDAVGVDFLRRVRQAANRMGGLIDDLLNLSRVSRADMRMERVELTSLANEVVRELRLHESDRDVAVSIAPGLAAQGDRDLLRIVLDNLLGNAWKYTLKTPSASIAFDCEIVDGVPTYIVRDNGAGFDPVYSHKLFQPFQRLHHDNEFPGHGIGLATVLRIIRRHGGSVSASGQPGNGAEFRFTLTTPPSVSI